MLPEYENPTQKTHWKKLTNPNYLGSWDIPENGELTITFTQVLQEKVINSKGEEENCIVAHLADGYKPFILNATNCKTIAKVCESNYIEDWAGRSFTLTTRKVKAFGDVVDAIRVKPVKVKKGKDTLSPASPRWQGALDALKNGTTTVEFITSKFTVSPQDLEILKGAVNA